MGVILKAICDRCGRIDAAEDGGALMRPKLPATWIQYEGITRSNYRHKVILCGPCHQGLRHYIEAG